MKRHWTVIVAGLLLIHMLIGGIALAQEGGSYKLSWSTVNGSGGASSGGNYDLSGVAGQAGTEALGGGGYTLGGGFWGGGASSTPPGSGSSHEVYLPLVIK